MLSFPFWNIILIEVFTNRFVKTKLMRGGGSWGDPITHSQCVTSYFSYINTNVNKQHNIMHDRQKPVSTIMVLSQKLFNFLIWEEQKKYTNKSKIRYELEVFISEQRLWSLVSSKVEKETKPVLSAEVHWIFSDVTVFYYFSELSYFVILCAQLTLREVAWHLQRSIGVSPPCSENDNEDDNRCLF